MGITLWRAAQRRRSKYNAQRCPCDQGGRPHWHDSLKERARCWVLHQRLAAGEIHALRVHPRYPLRANGQVICTYEADFEYAAADGHPVTEDVKGTRTDVYRLKRRMMHVLNGIEIVET